MSNRLREYHYPTEWKTAHELLQRSDVRVMPLFLSPHPLPLEQRPVDAIIDLSRLGLNMIKEENGYLMIGTLSSLQSIIDSYTVNSKFNGIISNCGRYAGPFGIRNYANLGGVLTDFSAPSELLLALLALDAEVIFRRPDNKMRTITLSSFLDGKEETVTGEVMYGIQVSTEIKGAFAHKRVARTLRDTAILAVVARIEVLGSVITTARITVSGASSRPARVQAIEQILTGHSLTPARLQIAARSAEDWAKPISDFRGSAEYRRAMAGILVQRAIESAWQEAAFELPSL